MMNCNNFLNISEIDTRIHG
uniref:Uncharacterized protein n=1 Tax=Lepeophtheirus salmonis TaxID=72036 RepID=A0A0K2U3A2_LEPSM